jgi:hypothetical protein
MPNVTQLNPKHRSVESELIEEMLATDAWRTAMNVIAKGLAIERGMVQSETRRSLGADLAHYQAVRAQARIDGALDAIFTLYREARVDMPQAIEHLLNTPGKLR